ncbi:MAG: response regulator [Spirochaetaceae bacterium]|nr:response regulator [Spirochaetaceae bacterium]
MALRMLIVEDNFISRSVLSRILEKYGSFDVATNGEEAVQAVQLSYEAGVPYDLVFLDIMMPVMDGQRALERIRDFEKNRGMNASEGCKIVMATALDDPQNVIAAFRNQCEGYITKPYNANSIIGEMRKLGIVN